MVQRCMRLWLSRPGASEAVKACLFRISHETYQTSQSGRSRPCAQSNAWSDRVITIQDHFQADRSRKTCALILVVVVVAECACAAGADALAGKGENARGGKVGRCEAGRKGQGGGTETGRKG